jgi:hypothetical protein
MESDAKLLAEITANFISALRDNASLPVFITPQEPNVAVFQMNVTKIFVMVPETVSAVSSLQAHRMLVLQSKISVMESIIVMD